MKCSININVDNSTVLRSLSDHFGPNKKELIDVINEVIERQNTDGTYVPSVAFSEWYDKHYKTPLDFNAENPKTLKRVILKYYKETVPSVHDSVRDAKAKSIVSTYGYSSASAREDGKRVVTGIMLRAHIDSLFERFDNSDDNIKDRYNRAKLIADKIISSSELSDKEKNTIRKAIKNSTTE